MPKIFVFTAGDRTPETTLICSYAFYSGPRHLSRAQTLRQGRSRLFRVFYYVGTERLAAGV